MAVDITVNGRKSCTVLKVKERCKIGVAASDRIYEKFGLQWTINTTRKARKTVTSGYDRTYEESCESIGLYVGRLTGSTSSNVRKLVRVLRILETVRLRL